MTKILVNPVHFKPMWAFARIGDEVDIEQPLQDPTGENGDMIGYSDAELIAVAVMLQAAIKASAVRNGLEESKEKHERRNNFVTYAEAFLSKLRRQLSTQFGEDVSI